MMLRFIHTHIPRTSFWDGLVRRGFIDDTSGVKLTVGGNADPSVMFNEAAKPGSDFDRIVREADRLCYVDRIQGGARLYPYENDPALVRYYREACGDRFLGFQIHETVSNFLADYHKILGDYNRYHGLTPELLAARPKTLEDLIRNCAIDFPTADGIPYLESQTAEQWLETPDLTCPENLISSAKKLFARRMHTADSGPQPLVAADSCVMATRLAADLGIANHMPEIGAQTPMGRVQLAIARGNAKRHRLPFGVYHEPWGGEPFSCCLFKRDGINEWTASEGGSLAYSPEGENGGSSLSLLRRVFYYALLCGASYLSEEWGACNTFYDWQDFEVTPYGRIKLDFLRFVREHPELGELYTPVALVLPRELVLLNMNAIAAGTNHYLFYEETPFLDDHDRERHIYDVLRAIFGDCTRLPPLNSEWRTLTNSAFGDLFDIVYEDDPEIFERYEYCVDLTEKPAFAAANRRHGDRILSGDDTGRLCAELTALQEKLASFTVEGDIHWMLDRTEKGFTTAFFNNNGVERSVAQGERKNPDYAQRVRVTLKNAGASVMPLLADTDLVRSGNEVSFTLAAGEMMILHIGA